MERSGRVTGIGTATARSVHDRSARANTLCQAAVGSTVMCPGLCGAKKCHSLKGLSCFPAAQRPNLWPNLRSKSLLMLCAAYADLRLHRPISMQLAVSFGPAREMPSHPDAGVGTVTHPLQCPPRVRHAPTVRAICGHHVAHLRLHFCGVSSLQCSRVILVHSTRNIRVSSHVRSQGPLPDAREQKQSHQ